MSRTEQVTITNMCMIYDDKGNIVVQDRLAKAWPGVTFPGGHVEAGESFHDAVVREVREETGLTIHHPLLCGVKQFTRDDGSRYLVLFYKTKQYEGVLHSSQEGEVFWIPRDTLFTYQLAPEFEQMLEVFEDDSLSECYYERSEQEAEDWKVRLY